MEVFRVYESFHESDESGTYEYGTFSTLERAQERIGEIWKKKNYPEPEHKSDLSWYSIGAWDHFAIYISRITVDAPLDDENIGYT